jgi:hypothetical protein
MPDINQTPPASTGSNAGATTAIQGGAEQNLGAGLGLLDQSTKQTLAIQNALLAHNLTIGPIMAAKSASEDAKKT